MSETFSILCIGFAALAFGAFCLLGAGWLFQAGQRLALCAA